MGWGMSWGVGRAAGWGDGDGDGERERVEKGTQSWLPSRAMRVVLGMVPLV